MAVVKVKVRDPFEVVGPEDKMEERMEGPEGASVQPSDAIGRQSQVTKSRQISGEREFRYLAHEISTEVERR